METNERLFVNCLRKEKDVLSMFIDETEIQKPDEQIRIPVQSSASRLSSYPRELELWLLYSGQLPEAGMGVSRVGIYTDFT